MARYCVRRKLEEKDLPQSSAAGDPPLPLVLPSQEGEPWELPPPLEDILEDAVKPRDHVTLSTDSPKATPVEDTTDDSEQPPRPGDPVPTGVDSVDPASIPTPSDESWTEHQWWRYRTSGG